MDSYREVSTALQIISQQIHGGQQIMELESVEQLDCCG